VTDGPGTPPARWYLRYLPALAILAPAVLSLCAWLAPASPGGLTGYYSRAPVTGWGIALVLAWFGSVVAVAQIAFARGRRTGALASLTRVSVAEVHRWACAVGLIGTAWAYWIASDGSPSRVVDLWRTQQFNTLRQGFDYGVGVPTLRYATILAGALTIVHLVGRNRPRPVDLLSIVGLVGTSFLASRLAVTAALFTAAVVLLAAPRLRRPRLGTAIIAAGLIVVLFTALNFSRNAGTYEDSGITNPFAMAAVNAQSYLAAPTQVTLGLATLVMEDRIEPATGGAASVGILLPTYANRVSPGGQGGSLSSVVDVAPSLTTNGALPELLYHHSWASLLAALLAVAAVAWGAGRFLVSAGVGPAVAGILVYGLAEIWRIFLLNQGIFHFLVLIGIAAVVVGKLREPTGAAETASAGG
jgi:hypothetical protein